MKHPNSEPVFLDFPFVSNIIPSTYLLKGSYPVVIISLVPYYQVFCHKKQENLCVFAPLRETIWIAGIARFR